MALFTKKSVMFIEKLMQKSDSATSDFFHSIEFLNIDWETRGCYWMVVTTGEDGSGLTNSVNFIKIH
jgi:hypothetical protein